MWGRPAPGPPRPRTLVGRGSHSSHSPCARSAPTTATDTRPTPSTHPHRTRPWRPATLQGACVPLWEGRGTAPLTDLLHCTAHTLHRTALHCCCRRNKLSWSALPPAQQQQQQQQPLNWPALPPAPRQQQPLTPFSRGINPAPPSLQTTPVFFPRPSEDQHQHTPASLAGPDTSMRLALANAERPDASRMPSLSPRIWGTPRTIGGSKRGRGDSPAATPLVGSGIKNLAGRSRAQRGD